MTTVLTLGTFDGLHVGHLELLRWCREMGTTIVALNRDGFVQRYKGRSPIHPYANRAEMLRASRFVDAVVCNAGDEDSKPAIEVVAPDVIAIGDDWAPPMDYLGQLGLTQGWLDERGIRVEYVPRTTGESTTRIRARS